MGILKRLVGGRPSASAYSVGVGVGVSVSLTVSLTVSVGVGVSVGDDRCGHVWIYVCMCVYMCGYL